MISTDLLARLQEADPELWKHYQDGMITGAGEPIPFFDESLTEAWLQHCIQAAIRARGWCYRTRYIDWVWVDIFDACDETLGEAECDTEAEALALAYLEAIEAIRP